MYKLTSQDAVIRLSDGAIIPAVQANIDWIEYQEWCRGGNTPQPADAPTPEQIIADLEASVQSELDRRARERNYDSIVSACSYAGALNPFQAESIAFLSWRAACWQRCYQILADCKAGNRPIPEPAELVAELPALDLP